MRDPVTSLTAGVKLSPCLNDRFRAAPIIGGVLALAASVGYLWTVHGLDMFFVVSGAFSIVTSLPLVYLALRSYRDGRELHRVQLEVARLVSEMRVLQHEIHTDQREARTDL